MRRWIRALLLLGLVGLVLSVVGGGFLYWSLLHDLPEITSVDEYQPSVTSVVLDRNDRPIGEFFVERRQVVPIERIPMHTQMAFVAAEDSKFFEHGGIDYVSILRAAWVDVTAGSIKQGASTITMQLVKQLLLSPEKRFRRKLREMILARILEENFTKQEILYLYLNHIYFGHGAHGIAEAAYTYFDKDVEALSVSESALLAGLPQRPSAYSPYRSPSEAERRRRYVLKRMRDDKIIDLETYASSLESPPEIAPPKARDDFAAASYFTEEVRRYLFDRLGGEVVLNGGLRIETSLDLDLQKAAVKALRKGLVDHDHRQGYRGALRTVAAGEIVAEAEKLAAENNLIPAVSEDIPEDTAAEALAVEEVAAGDADLEPGDLATEEVVPFDQPLLGVVAEVDSKAQTARVLLAPEIEGEVALADVEWAREPDPTRRPRPVKDISKVFGVGDVVQFLRLPDAPDDVKSNEASDSDELVATLPRLTIHQDPIVQGALLSVEVETGDVLAMVGGYDYDQSQFNRVTQASRQPGSAFKPFIYGAALSRGYTPVATLYDRPIVYEDPISGFVWRPQNYSRHFYGPLPMRTALVRSINNATVHLFRDVGVDFVIDYARRLGFSSPLNRDLSLALGSSGVTLQEITTAYSIFPNKGRRLVPQFIHKVTDAEGNVLLQDIALGQSSPPVLEPLVAVGEEESEPSYPDAETPASDQIISPAAAYLMCDLLMAVVKDPRGTGYRLRRLGRPVGGKTGTTNDQADAWFMGFSPEITTGVWVGHDESRLLGWGETGSRAAAPVWVDYMEVALADRPVRDFEPPDDIVFQRIDRATGLLADSKTEDAYFQPFLEDTEPTQTAHTVSSATDAARALREDSF